jgi:hypothetical protein
MARAALEDGAESHDAVYKDDNQRKASSVQEHWSRLGNKLQKKY